MARDLIPAAAKLLANLAFNTSLGGGSAPVAGFAQGGYAQSGLNLVGERGPELVDFSQPGRVYSNEVLGAALSTNQSMPSINYSPTIIGSDEPTVHRVLREYEPTFRNIIKDEVITNSNRPSSYYQRR